MTLQLEDLIGDALLQIFEYLDPADLHSLQCTGVENFAIDSCLKRHSDRMLITGSKCFPDHNFVGTSEDRLRIHYQWLRGDLQVKDVFGQDNLKHIGKLRMDPRHIYLSNKGELRIYDRLADGSPSENFRTYGNIDDPVISTMTLRGDPLFTGNYYGECSYIRRGQKVIEKQKIHDSYKDIIAMEFHPDKEVLATANFREIKLFQVTEHQMAAIGEMDWRARCLKVDEQGDQLLVGNVLTPFHNANGDIIQLCPLSLYDLGTLQKRDLNCSSPGVVDMVWHSNPQVALTGHWTGDVRMFDLRTDSDVLTVPKEGVQDVNVSLQYDGQFGVFCGYRNTSEVVLYDLRNPKSVLRSYGTFKHHELSTYLLDIVVDPTHLLVANFNDVRMIEFQ